tara:strand:- start:84 stop:494 length:411 start_codon:yes stop_codon:yes gene_type:complete
MSHLDKLTISRRIIPPARPRHGKDAPEFRRNKLIANLEEQIELASLAIEGKPLELTRKRGHGAATVRPRLWWQKQPDGRICAQVRYNKIAINLGGRGTTIEVDGLKKLPAAFRAVIRAVKAGELDKAIERAARRSS